MCWITFKPLKAKVAKRNIKVLKVLYIHPSEPTVLVPYFYSGVCKYSINGENPVIHITSAIKYNSCNGYTDVNLAPYAKYAAIYEGYHSYAANCSVRNVTPTEMFVMDHYFCDDECTGRQVHLVECIIPKGTTYYRNEFNEYVSENIVINKILKTFEHE